MVLSSELVGVIVGGVLAVGSGMLITYFAKLLEEKKSKKYISSALLSEITANQNRLQPWVKVFKVLAGVVEDKEKIQVPRMISFDRTIYSAISDKIGLLDPERGEKVVQYYAKTKFIEDENYILEGPVFHGIDVMVVGPSFKKIEGNKELKEYFKNVGEAWDMGWEAIKSLKEKI